MTKKDYELLAAAIRRSGVRSADPFRQVEEFTGALADIVGTLCEELERDNPRFNADRFRAACGV